jgi:hypothetical protein
MVDVYNSKWKIRVVQELQRWSERVLTAPSAFFNGIPPCPYARQAWADSKVKVAFGGPSEVLALADGWSGSSDVIIVVAQDWPNEEIEGWCESQSKALREKDLTLMAFVPGGGPDTGQPTEEMEDWEPLVDEEYAMVFIQSLSDVNAASESLEASGYYENCTPEFRKYVFNRREGTDHARQQEVNEEADPWSKQEVKEQGVAQGQALPGNGRTRSQEEEGQPEGKVGAKKPGGSSQEPPPGAGEKRVL